MIPLCKLEPTGQGYNKLLSLILGQGENGAIGGMASGSLGLFNRFKIREGIYAVFDNITF